MLFNSLEFFIFFPTVAIIYFSLPYNWRWLFLLLASCFFYMAFVPAYILILAVTIVVDYVAGILIEKTSGKKRKLYLIISIITNVGFLAFFKYYNFFIENVDALARLLHWNYSPVLLSIILPIGLSFHTFQAMSYTIEVYRGKQKAERHFGIYALYVMFFPQLVAGPIERPQNLLHQFYERHEFDYQNAVTGLVRIGWGLFKKVVIADRLAVFVNQVYNNPHSYDSLPLIFASVLFAYQLYCDFSGYSDIALGSAQVLGFRLMENFDRPYYSRSIPEFWRRWHISLFSWFRDYLYYPLVFGNSRRRTWRVYFSLMVTFLISGLWHGASWKFVMMGGLHGVYMACSSLTKNFRQRLVNLLGLAKLPAPHAILQTIFTFSLVCLGWIFFRANSVSDAFYIISHIFSGLPHIVSELSPGYLWQMASFKVGLEKYQLLIGLLAVVVLEGVQFFQNGRDLFVWLRSWPAWLRWSAYYFLAAAIIIFGMFGAQQFIYFQF